VIASGSLDNTVKLWEPNGTFIQTLEGHSAAVSYVVFSPNSKIVGSISYDGKIKLWKSDGSFIRDLEGYSAKKMTQHLQI
jgi:WD40 repeat protein